MIHPLQLAVGPQQRQAKSQSVSRMILFFQPSGCMAGELISHVRLLGCVSGLWAQAGPHRLHTLTMETALLHMRQAAALAGSRLL